MTLHHSEQHKHPGLSVSNSELRGWQKLCLRHYFGIMTGQKEDILVLFDVDGTLTTARQKAKPEMEDLLHNKLKKKATIGLVSGSDLVKVSEQMGENCVAKFDYVFPENGLVAYHKGSLIAKESIAAFMGEEKVQIFLNFCLGYMSKLELPVKRGNFIEFRSGLINICPPGRSVTQEQRDQFGALDNDKKIRRAFVEALNKEFPDFGLYFAIGGQISIDAFPIGWDKRFCLQFVEDKYKEIHFFGDRTAEGGNDYHIYSDPRTIGHDVTSPEDTMEQLTKLFNL
jgi:phosphomannomutase